MLSDEVAGRIDRLIEAHRRGVFSEVELAGRLGDWLTAENLGSVLDRLSPECLRLVAETLHVHDRSADARLHPEASPFADGPHDWERDRLVRQFLCGPRTPDERVVAFGVALPSFQPEWAVRLIRADSAGYRVRLTRFAVLLSASSGATPEVETFESPIPEADADRVVEVWATMLRNVRPQRCLPGDADGIRFHFGCDFGTEINLAGRTHSPRPDSPTGRLVAVLDALRAFAAAGEPPRLTAVRDSLSWFG